MGRQLCAHVCPSGAAARAMLRRPARGEDTEEGPTSAVVRVPCAARLHDAFDDRRWPSKEVVLCEGGELVLHEHALGARNDAHVGDEEGGG